MFNVNGYHDNNIIFKIYRLLLIEIIGRKQTWIGIIIELILVLVIILLSNISR